MNSTYYSTQLITHDICTKAYVLQLLPLKVNHRTVPINNTSHTWGRNVWPYYQRGHDIVVTFFILVMYVIRAIIIALCYNTPKSAYINHILIYRKGSRLSLAAQQATLASTPAPVISTPIAAPVVTATKPKKTPQSGAKMAAISGRLTLQKIQIL